VIAEGVESARQLAWLRDFKCDLVQGYHLSKPLSGEAAAELLSGGRPTPQRRLPDPGTTRL